MKPNPRPWLKLAVAVATLLLSLAAAAFPLVFTEAVVASFLRILEVVARMS